MGGAKAVLARVPERYKNPPRPKTAEEEAAESEYAFGALERSLTTVSKQWGQ